MQISISKKIRGRSRWLPLKTIKMKKIINLTALSLTLSVALFTACQKKNNSLVKQEVLQQDVKSENSSVETTLNQRVQPRMYYKSDGYCHSGIALNCVKLPEIVVTPTQRQILIDASNGTPSDVAIAFQRPELEAIALELPQEYIDALLSRNYYIKLSAENETEICFIAGTNFPVTIDNLTFAFQLVK